MSASRRTHGAESRGKSIPAGKHKVVEMMNVVRDTDARRRGWLLYTTV
ncbi:MAG: hypothetical protein K2P44_12240 [Lachnospiraceae bacterium]|nr:hypothetical protein [Lachnospiraceae bacterium]